MKNLIAILLLIPLLISAQDETTKVTVTLQARDCEYIGVYIAHNADFEDLFDAAKAKFRVANPPTGTTNVTIDTIVISQWLGIDQLLRRDPYAIGGSAWARINTALRNVNNTFLTATLNERDSEDTNLFMNNRNIGRFKLRRQ